MGQISKKLARRFTRWSGQFRQQAKTTLIPKDVHDVETLVKDGHDPLALRLHELLKFGLSLHHWNEFVFQGYHHHQYDAVFLAGLPDVKGSLPHA